MSPVLNYTLIWWAFRIPARLKSNASYGCKRCTGQARLRDDRLMAKVKIGLEKLEVVSSFCYLGDCLSSGCGCELDTITKCLSHGDNSMSSCPSSPPAHLASHPEEEFTLRLSGVSCSIQAKAGPHRYWSCIACNLTTELWFARCAASPPSTKSARKISRRGCTLIIWQKYSAPAVSDGMAMLNVTMVGWKKSRNSIPLEVMAVATPRKPWQTWSTWTA